MLTTAGAARATASAKLCTTTVGRAGEAGTLGGACAPGAAADLPSSAGLYQTTRNAAARPTMAALIKKPTRTRAFCNYYRSSELVRDGQLSVYNALPIFFGKHCRHRGLREDLSTLLRGNRMSDQVDHSRRRLLTAATVGTGAIGVAFAAVPFLASWQPSARAKALGAPADVDASRLDAGQMLKVVWRGQPVFVVRRAPGIIEHLGDHDAMLADPASDDSQQPDYIKASGAARARNPE